MDIPILYLLFSIIIFFLAGFLIGSIGVGGVILVPFLTFVLNIDIHIAIATSVFTFFFSGLVGYYQYYKRIKIDWNLALWLMLGCVPGAFIGAAIAWEIPQNYLKMILGVVILISSYQILKKSENTNQTKIIDYKIVFLIGLFTGLGSPITGTGGPLIFVPAMILLKAPIILTIGLSQIAQMPIAFFASISNTIYGEINFKLGLTIIIFMIIGVYFGVKTSTKLDSNIIKRIVGYGLLIIGLFIITTTLHSIYS